MLWNELYTIENKPEFRDISSYVENSNWDDLCEFIEDTYGIEPAIEYSKCSAAPGWNVKYKKSSRALCTLYPNKEYFTCLISIGRKEAGETELILTVCNPYLQELYHNTKPFNGSRWLMIDVTTKEILENVKELLCIRIHPAKIKTSAHSENGICIEELVKGLRDKDNTKACMNMNRLADLSENNNEVYRFFDIFSEMLQDKNSYVRNRAITLIAANAKWDTENKLDEIIDRYLRHITDEKPITSRQCINGLTEIARYKPDLIDVIAEALSKANIGFYKDSMRLLIAKDIQEVLSELKKIR